jgi:nucleoside-diphosphate-sugar epimerase
MEVLAARPGFEPIGLCRRPPEGAASGLRFVAADLTDAAACRDAIAACLPVEYLVCSTRAPFGEGGVEDVPVNVAMLRNLLDAAETTALRHVHLVEGTKWYGMHLGPFATPAREDDPRHLPPNFYYDQQDLLAERARAGGWHWSASRPGLIVDCAPGRGRNLISSVGAYAAICRELDVAFDFPGRAGAYDRLMELTDATLLARAIAWMLDAPEAQDQAFNITNGDVFRWSRLWPAIGRHLGLRPGTVRPLRLVDWMADKEPVWARIAARHGLRPLPLSSVVRWDFLDYALGLDYDVMASTTKARLAGFAACEDTQAMFLRYLDAYREARVLP